MSTTAVAKLHTKGEPTNGNVSLGFSADYADERNKEWAQYTPALGITMNVREDVAENFVLYGNYLVTFELAENNGAGPITAEDAQYPEG